MAHAAYCWPIFLPKCPFIQEHVELYLTLIHDLFPYNMVYFLWGIKVKTSKKSSKTSKKHLIKSLEKKQSDFSPLPKGYHSISNISSFRIQAPFSGRCYKFSVLGLNFLFVWHCQRIPLSCQQCSLMVSIMWEILLLLLLLIIIKYKNLDLKVSVYGELKYIQFLKYHFTSISQYDIPQKWSNFCN